MKLQDIQIRQTTSADLSDIMEVTTQAFGYDKEAKFTADLLGDETAEPMISLMALHEGEAVGHILFTRACFAGLNEHPLMHILAPLAVKPGFQNLGIGGLLIREGMSILQRMGSELVFVLGHKDYYPRHGFLPDARALGYPAPYPIADEFAECWMVMPTGEKGFGVGKGTIRCAAMMDKPEHWRNEESDR